MGPVEAEKYEVTREKRIGAIRQAERILEAIKKNPYFLMRKKSLFFDVMENDQFFYSKVNHFQYDHRFLFRGEIGNIRGFKEEVLQKLIKLR